VTEVTEVIGRNVREIRRAQRLTQAELGRRLRWHTQAVSAAEHGRRDWRARDVAMVASVLGCPVASLFTEIPPRPDNGEVAA
jgi:transcriptional regulator with XRE-family HTH domain